MKSYLRKAKKIIAEVLKISHFNQEIPHNHMNICKQKESGTEQFYNFDYAALPDDQVVIRAEQALLKLTDYSRAGKLIENFFKNHQTTRINILSSDLNDWLLLGLKECLDNTFSWIVLMASGERQYSADIDVAECVSYKQMDALDVVTKEFLVHVWQQDYVEKILHKYPATFRVSQLESFVSRLEKSAHFVFLNQDKIIGHGCYNKVRHPVLSMDCLYWHQWISEDANREQRCGIHRTFFRQLFSLGLPAMSGVAIANAHALRHCLRNGFAPVLLSVRKIY